MRSLHERARRTGADLVYAIRRVKGHPNPWVRRGAGTALVVGGVFGFLPILGFWMIPLGLLILSNEVGWLRRARRRTMVRFSGLARRRRARQT